jgi:hypothetical protein
MTKLKKICQIFSAKVDGRENGLFRGTSMEIRQLIEVIITCGIL